MRRSIITLLHAGAVMVSAAVCTPPAMSDETHDTPHTHPANRLVDQTSPYLLQHAYNPVQWYPWGEEAFAAARAANKPIFLSIGYSTCYWCHVMERESFENPEVAALLNAYFVPVKVDREERPDVDDVYMTAVQIMTRHGGWPLSAFLEPDTLMPFFGGTYFPLHGQGNRPGFLQLCEAIHQAWQEKQPELREQAYKVGQAVARRLADQPQIESPSEGIVDTAIAQLMASYDATHGGYGDAPKFPMPVHLDLLIQTGWDRSQVRDSVRHTLDRMAMGGMYDQVGGGFHRYSTDEQWLVPHFEKMLYDNAMLASIYAEACQRTGDGFYCAIAAEIVEYVLREMVDPSGAFWSAQDAESNAREGESYLWTPEQIDTVLSEAGMPADDARFIKSVYGLDAGPNFRDPHHPGEAPSNVLHLVDRPHDLAEAHGMTGGAFHERIMRINAVLLAHRDTRDQPLTDDKILSGWNGLMIGGMADVGRVLERPEYIEAARRAAAAIRTRMWSEDNGLKRTARGDVVNDIPAFLEDYAFMVRGLLRLYEATEDRAYLEWAEHLMVQARAQFWAEPWGWLDVPEGQSDLFVRGRSLYDGAVPSGTSVMLDNQATLAALTGDAAWLDAARDGLERIGWNMNRSPQGTSQAVVAYHRLGSDATTEEAGAAEKPAGPVRVSLDPGVVVARGGLAKVEVEMTISAPYHVSLRDPDRHDILPLDIQCRTGGVDLEVDWPGGHPFVGPLGAVQVVSGVVRIPVTISVPATHSGPVGLVVSWQACDERICLRPRTEVLTVDVTASE